MIGFHRYPWVLGALHLLSLGRAFFRHHDRDRRAAGQHLTEFYDRAWREAAAHLGASYTPLGSGIAEILLGGIQTRVMGYTCPIDDPVTLAIAGDRPLTYRLLARAGLRIPRYAEFTLKEMARAIGFMESGRGECVVKPARGTGGGRAVTTGIRRRSHLTMAAAAASVYGDDLLIEEQLEGSNYRLLYLDGVLLDSYVRQPPTVVGDGRSTVARLVRRANSDRLSRGSGLSQVLLTIDLDMRRTLAKQGLSLRSVLPAGTVVTLKTVVNENCGADNATATHLLCDSIIADGARAADALQVRLAGVDVVTPDPGVPLAEAGGAILEVNTTPGFYYHYHKREGAFPVAVHLLKKLLADHPAVYRLFVSKANCRIPKEVNPW
jgi:cyanophycin synthetase